MIRYLKKGKKKCYVAAVRGEEKCESSSSADTKVNEERGRMSRCSKHGGEIPLQAVETVVKQLVHLQTMEDHTRADLHTVTHGGAHGVAGG